MQIGLTQDIFSPTVQGDSQGKDKEGIGSSELTLVSQEKWPPGYGVQVKGQWLVSKRAL